MKSEQHKIINDSFYQWRSSRSGADFRKFFLLIQEELYEVARRICKDSNDAEDAVAETMASVLRSSDTFRGESHVYFWIASIVANESINTLIVRRKFSPMNTTTNETLRWGSSGFEASVPANQSEIIDQLQLKMVVQEGLSTLPDKYRIAVVLCYIEGMTIARAAEILGLRAPQLQWNAKAGIEKLKSFFEKRGFAALQIEALLLTKIFDAPGPGLQQKLDGVIHRAFPEPSYSRIAIAAAAVCVIAAGIYIFTDSERHGSAKGSIVAQTPPAMSTLPVATDSSARRTNEDPIQSQKSTDMSITKIHGIVKSAILNPATGNVDLTPVPNAAVRLFDESGNFLQSVTAAETGQIEIQEHIQKLERSFVQVIANDNLTIHERHLGIAATPLSTPDMYLGTLTLNEAYTLAGAIHQFGSDTGIPGVKVSLHLSSREVAKGETNSTGDFSIPHVPAGIYNAKIQFGAFTESVAGIEVGPNVTNTLGVKSFSELVERNVYVELLQPAGAPLLLAGADVRLRSDNSLLCQTNAMGKGSIPVSRTDLTVIPVVVQHPLLGAPMACNLQFNVDQTETALSVSEAPTAEIAFVDATTGAPVTITEAKAFGGLGALFPPQLTMVENRVLIAFPRNADGSAGIAKLHISASDLAKYINIASPSPGLTTIALEKGIGVSGVVHDEHDNPAPHAILFLKSKADLVATAFADGSGAFHFTNINSNLPNLEFFVHSQFGPIGRFPCGALANGTEINVGILRLGATAEIEFTVLPTVGMPHLITVREASTREEVFFGLVEPGGKRLLKNLREANYRMERLSTDGISAILPQDELWSGYAHGIQSFPVYLPAKGLVALTVNKLSVKGDLIAVLIGDGVAKQFFTDVDSSGRAYFTNISPNTFRVFIIPKPFYSDNSVNANTTESLESILAANAVSDTTISVDATNPTYYTFPELVKSDNLNFEIPADFTSGTLRISIKNINGDFVHYMETALMGSSAPALRVPAGKYQLEFVQDGQVVKTSLVDVTNK
ncbi:MAG: sigma-70 family RNA polymerase sigma factor [Planctomycetota bacterium]